MLRKAPTTCLIFRPTPSLSESNLLPQKASNLRFVNAKHVFFGRRRVFQCPPPHQVPGQILVAELHQLLTEHEATCHRTCFSLRLGGVPLDGQAKLSSVQGVQEGAAIQVEEGNCRSWLSLLALLALLRTNQTRLFLGAELYAVRDAHLHLRHVRDLLRSLDPADAYNGVNGSSLSYLSYYTQRGKGQAPSSFPFFGFFFSTIPPNSRPQCQPVSVKGGGSPPKWIPLTSGPRSTCCPAPESVPSLRCSPPETTGR